MKRPRAYTAAILVSAVPAVVGLWGNAAFSQAVPVRVPASAQLATTGTPASRSTPSPSSSPTGIPSVDDQGGNRPSGTRTTESGDDKSRNRGATAPSATASPPDDHGGSGSSGSYGGSDDAAGHSSGGHGADD